MNDFNAKEAAGEREDHEPPPEADARAAAHGFRATWARTAGNARIGKVKKASGKWPPTPGATLKSYLFETREYASLVEFYIDCRKRQKSGVWALVAGELRPDLDPNEPHQRVRENFIDAASTKLTFDFDGLEPNNADTPIDDADAYAGDAVFVAMDRMPEAFKHAMCMVSATSSTGQKIISTGKPSEGKARFRATWEMTRAQTCRQREIVTKAVKARPGLGGVSNDLCSIPGFEFINRPVFLEGEIDPIEDPVYLLEGGLLDIDAVCAELGVDLAAGDDDQARNGGALAGVGGPQTAKPGLALDLPAEQAEPLLRALLTEIGNGDGLRDGYNEWFGVVAATFNASSGTDWGREIAVDWTGISYDTKEVYDKWKALAKSNDGRNGIDYLLKLAMWLAAKKKEEAECAGYSETTREAAEAAANAAMEKATALEAAVFDIERALAVKQFPDDADPLSLGTIGYRRSGEGVRLKDFVAYMQSHAYVYLPAGDFWPAIRVDARVGAVSLQDKNGKPIVDKKTGKRKTTPASAWLARHAPVEQMTWAPGLPQLIRDKLIGDGGWIDRNGVTVLNLYRAPTIKPGDAIKAGPWVEHVKRIYPDEADHIIAFLAHRVQKPGEKINHGLVLGGPPCIGKDTMLEPVKYAVGAWNFKEVSPKQVLGRFNGFLKSVVLRISETKDMGEFDRFAFYDHMKTILAAPPDVLRVDEKHLREHDVFNVCGVIMTTNHKTDGIYLPADDRRHLVAWSNAVKDDFVQSYWDNIWAWYEREGFGHVAAYLAELDLSNFSPKAPPEKTSTFWTIVDANRAPEDAELADVLDRLNKDAMTLDMLMTAATGEIQRWLWERKNRRAIPHRLETCGYTPVRNNTREDGLFIIKNRRQVVYARVGLSIRDRFKAVRLMEEQAASQGEQRQREEDA